MILSASSAAVGIVGFVLYCIALRPVPTPRDPPSPLPKRTAEENYQALVAALRAEAGGGADGEAGETCEGDVEGALVGDAGAGVAPAKRDGKP
jgi:hypothetical protein